MKSILDTLNNAICERIISIYGEQCRICPYGLAEPVLWRGDDERTVPAIVNHSGECIDVFKDCDKNDLTFYHKLQSISFDKSDQSFGSLTSYSKNSEVSLLVYGKRTINPYALNQTICAVISRQTDCELVSVDFNAVMILASEYNGMPFFLPPNFFLFKINYRITSAFDNRCIK